MSQFPRPADRTLPADRIVVFAGPSLHPADRVLLNARYLPPAQLGCVLRSVHAGAEVIGLIDGYFERTPTVFHKEILWALQRRVRVYGAASMGALRAAELAPFGMRGVGRVFELFRSGELEDDDEVAVMHDPAPSGFRPRSVAMVDIRETVAQAVAAGVLGADGAVSVVAAAKSLYYPERDYLAAIRVATARGFSSAQLTAFGEWVATHQTSVKQDDAAALLCTIAREHTTADRGDHQYVADGDHVLFEPTAFWQQIEREEERYVPTAE